MPTTNEGPAPGYTEFNSDSSKDAGSAAPEVSANSGGQVAPIQNAEASTLPPVIVNHSQPLIPTEPTSPTFTIPSRSYQLFALPLEEDDEDDVGVNEEDHARGSDLTPKRSKSVWTTKYWKRYFRPMFTKSYYKAFIHVALLDSVFAFLAWSFVVTCLRYSSASPRPYTSLFVTLPVFILVCFVVILGSRVLARLELASQTFFHGPTVVDSPYRPYCIFTRIRTAEAEDLEMGQHVGDVEIKETSFLMNTRLMFLDRTSYQALFYFLL
ncbi:hypothetical protein AB1N83_010748, partial [Pleurotus pulmonarius]